LTDQRTVDAYAAGAAEFAAAYKVARPAYLGRLVKAIDKPGARVLDIGCGNGRDLAAFAAEGYEVTGVEPVAAFRAAAERDFPELRGRIRDGALPGRMPDDMGPSDAVHFCK
jgi:SAM-dependent methyltransferase